MKNVYKFLIVVFAIFFIGSGLMAQINTDKSKTKTKYEQKLKLESKAKEKQVKEITPEDRTPIKVKWTPKEGVDYSSDGVDSFCSPAFTTGCTYGDGISDFAVGDIENYGSGCAELNGTGWSEYYDLGPAIFIPGMEYTFTMGAGYSNQYVNIWIDFNDDEDLTENEMILQDYWIESADILYDVLITIPGFATAGDHAMRVMAVYASSFTDPCDSYIYGEAEDYTVSIAEGIYGTLSGVVTELATGNPIEGAEVIAAGFYSTTTLADGSYSFDEVVTGDINVFCTKEGYNPNTQIVTIEEGQPSELDFELTAPIMEIIPVELNAVVDPFGALTEYLDIANTGNGQLIWNAVLDTVGADPWISITLFTDTVQAGNSSQMQIDFDALEYIPGTVLNATLTYTSDPNVDSIIVPISMTVGNLDFGTISGNVMLDGVAPYNIGDVTQLVVEAGPYSANPDSNGDYMISAYPDTYDVSATLYGYDIQMADGVVLEPAGTEVIDFSMPCLYGLLTGNVSALNGGMNIEGATVIALGTGLSVPTDASGNFELLVQAGTYDVKASASGYAAQVENISFDIQTTASQDYVLDDLEGIIVVIDLDPTPNPPIVDVIQSFFPGGLVVYTDSINGYELDEEVLTVFLLLGIYNNNYNLTEDDALVITTWMETYSDRSVYMEGGDTWAFDDSTSLHAKFNINGLDDGSSDLTTVEGIDSYWSGFSWAYAGENSWIDHIEAIEPAINIMQNPDVGYYCGVAYDEGTYKTVGASFEVTGLDDGTGSFSMGVACVMGYFGYPVFAYGNADGYVTEMATGNPLEGVNVSVGGMTSTLTDVDGYYYLEEVLIGIWPAYAEMEGYNLAVEEVSIEEGLLTSQDFELTAPTMEINSELNVSVAPFVQVTDYIDIVNNGNGPLIWTAVMDTVGSGNDMWLTVTQFVDTVAPGETGQMQLDFDANTILAGTVLTGTMSFSSDPNVGDLVVDISFTVGDLAFGYIQGNVFLDGIVGYNIGDVTQVLVEVGPYITNPDINGDYELEVYPGTYDLTSTLYGYTQQTVSGFVIEEGITYTDNDFTMPCILGKLFGNVTDIDTGDPIENAQITAFDTPVLGVTDIDGNYEVFIEAGIYAVQADHATYAPEVVQDLEIVSASDIEQDFALTYQCVFCEASGGGDEFIDGIEFGSISNLTTGYQDGYVDYTSMSTLVIPGFSYTMTIHTGNMYASDDYAVWIDWNMDCTFDNETEIVVCDFNIGADINTFEIPIPPTAQPGVATMRVRLKYSGSDCGDPCGTTSYGEVEDYSIIITPGTYGSLSGFVNELSTGNPIGGAEVNVAGFYTETTLADGSYFFEEVITGTWDLTTAKEGYNNSIQSVTIEEDMLTEQDVEMTAPILEFNPESISITLQPNQQSDEPLVISNTGNGPVDWTANLSLAADNSKEIGDIVYELNVGNISGETQTFGSEWDGIYLWTSGGASYMDPNQLYQFDFDGNLVGQFAQPLDGSSSGIRDLAFDGTYLYGGNEVAFYQIDPTDGTITELFDNNFGQTITALAWVPVFNAFYSKNQGSDIIVFDIDGNLIESIPVVGADNVSGAAWDNSSNKLWLFNQSGSPQSTFMEYDIVSKELTGVTQQVANIGSSSSQMAAGAFYATDMVPGFAVLGGSTQGSPNMAFAMDMGSSAAWIGIDLESGTLGAGDQATMTVAIDATDLLPAVYEAEVIFSSDPMLGEISIPVQLTVEGLIPPVNLFAYFACTDVYLTWNNAGGTPDSYNIYRDDVLLTSVSSTSYTDMLVDPSVELCYTVTAVYGSEESQPTAASCLTVPLPENLEISFIDGWGSGDTAIIVWDEPEACVMADAYNVYRDNEFLELTVDTFYYDLNLTSDFYQYHVTAVYYFGESENSEIVPILIVSLDENKVEGIVVSPNPAIDYVQIKSDIHVNSYTILDMNGHEVESRIIESSNFTINVSQYSEGIYYLRFNTDKEPILRKIILK